MKYYIIKIFKGGVIIFLLFILYRIFVPNYEYHYYEFDDEKDTVLTIIIYRKSDERGLLFANGKIKNVPDEGLIKNPDFSGFDAMFDCIATCERGIITINYEEGYFEPNNVEDLKTKRLNTYEFYKLKKIEGQNS